MLSLLWTLDKFNTEVMCTYCICVCYIDLWFWYITAISKYNKNVSCWYFSLDGPRGEFFVSSSCICSFLLVGCACKFFTVEILSIYNCVTNYYIFFLLYHSWDTTVIFSTMWRSLLHFDLAYIRPRTVCQTAQSVIWKRILLQYSIKYFQYYFSTF